METSAKAGYNVKALFRKLATALPGMENSSLASTTNFNIKLTKAHEPERSTAEENGCGC